MGDCPVMNAARPAVQLCCPYQSVNSAPSSLHFVGVEANVDVSQCPSAEVCSDRTMHRKPMWLIPVSIICGWRAAGR